MTQVVVGFATGLSLIVAIGAQNAYLLRQALRQAHVAAIVAVCALSDLVLIVAGVAGVGVVVRHAGWALTAVRWLGVAMLVGYALGALRRARRPDTLQPAGSDEGGRGAAVAKAVALTWLNPHVYLDTVVLLGSIANTHGSPGRWWFAAGAAAASLAWFGALGYGGRRLGPLLRSPRAWQILDVLIAATMLLVAAELALG